MSDREGQAARFLGGATRVRMTPDGRVTADGEFLGYVHERAIVQPGRGLVLYARREAALLDLDDRSRVWGRLQAGALVAVRPIADGYEVAPGPPFGELRFFVGREDLSAEPSPLAEYSSADAFCGSVKWRPGGEFDVTAWTDPCLPVRLGPEPGRIRQRLAGVELDGTLVDETRCRAGDAAGDAGRPSCVAETVVRRGASMRWIPAPGAVQRDVQVLPAHHASIAGGGRLRRHFDSAEAVFVLQWTGEALTCGALSEETEAQSRYDVTRSAPLQRMVVDEDGVSLESLLGNYKMSVHYAEVGGGDDYVDLLQRQLPQGALSYSRSAVERWFFERDTCEAARMRANTNEQPWAAAGSRLHAKPTWTGW